MIVIKVILIPSSSFLWSSLCVWRTDNGQHVLSKTKVPTNLNNKHTQRIPSTYCIMCVPWVEGMIALHLLSELHSLSESRGEAVS